MNRPSNEHEKASELSTHFNQEGLNEMRYKPTMKCGHTANATDEVGNPMCVICMEKEEDVSPELKGRMARCGYCGKTMPSNEAQNQAFFHYERGRSTDSYYDGCKGWD